MIRFAKSDTLTGVVAWVMNFLSSDGLNIQDRGWLGTGMLGCNLAALQSSLGTCKIRPSSQIWIELALCPKVYVSNLVCYSLKCQP